MAGIPKQALCFSQESPRYASCGPDAIAQLRAGTKRGEPFEVVVTNAHLRDGDGFAVLHVAHAQRWSAQVIVVSETSDITIAMQTLEARPFAFLLSSSLPVKLRPLVERAVAQQSSRRAQTAQPSQAAAAC